MGLVGQIFLSARSDSQRRDLHKTTRQGSRRPTHAQNARCDLVLVRVLRLRDPGEKKLKRSFVFKNSLELVLVALSERDLRWKGGSGRRSKPLFGPHCKRELRFQAAPSRNASGTAWLFGYSVNSVIRLIWEVIRLIFL